MHGHGARPCGLLLPESIPGDRLRDLGRKLESPRLATALSARLLARSSAHGARMRRGATTAPIAVRYDLYAIWVCRTSGTLMVSGTGLAPGIARRAGTRSWPKRRDSSARAAGLGRMPHGAACCRPAWR